MLASPQARGFRSGTGAGAYATATAGIGPAGAAAGAAAGRSGSSLYQRDLEPRRIAARTRRRTTPTPTAGTRTTTSSTPAANRLLPRFDRELRGVDRGPGRPRTPRPDARRLHGRVRPAPRVALEREFGGSRRAASTGRRLFAVLAGAGSAARCRSSVRPIVSAREPIDGPFTVLGRRRNDVSCARHRSGRTLHRVLGRPFAITSGKPIRQLFTA